MNGLSRIPLRSIRQGAKAPFKTKEQGRKLQNYYNHQKTLKKLLTNDIIKSQERKRGAQNEKTQTVQKNYQMAAKRRVRRKQKSP